jgi:hypothetical protein
MRFVPAKGIDPFGIDWSSFIFDERMFYTYIQNGQVKVWHRAQFKPTPCNMDRWRCLDETSGDICTEVYDAIVTAVTSWYVTGGAGMALWEYLNAVLGDL